jgi:hypothetical protein
MIVMVAQRDAAIGDRPRTLESRQVQFEGTVVAIFVSKKGYRYVLENDDGVELIFGSGDLWIVRRKDVAA